MIGAIINKIGGEKKIEANSRLKMYRGEEQMTHTHSQMHKSADTNAFPNVQCHIQTEKTHLGRISFNKSEIIRWATSFFIYCVGPRRIASSVINDVNDQRKFGEWLLCVATYSY